MKKIMFVLLIMLISLILLFDTSAECARRKKKDPKPKVKKVEEVKKAEVKKIEPVKAEIPVNLSIANDSICGPFVELSQEEIAVLKEIAGKIVARNRIENAVKDAQEKLGKLKKAADDEMLKATYEKKGEKKIDQTKYEEIDYKYSRDIANLKAKIYELKQEYKALPR